MMVRLYLVRHGQTSWNAQRRYQGQTDIPLDEIGRTQIAALCPRLAALPFATVYASALSRAYETAALLHVCDVPGQPHTIICLPALNEMSYGQWESHTREEIAQLFPDNWHRYRRDPVGEAPLGGESRGAFHSRVLAGLREIVDRHPSGGDMLLAVHGGTLRAIVTHILQMDLHGYRRLRFDNASLSIVDVHEDLSGVVTLLNDTAHLISAS
jgi:broad specificity phosphatase PhoE